MRRFWPSLCQQHLLSVLRVCLLVTNCRWWRKRLSSDRWRWRVVQSVQRRVWQSTPARLRLQLCRCYDWTVEYISLYRATPCCLSVNTARYIITTSLLSWYEHSITVGNASYRPTCIVHSVSTGVDKLQFNNHRDCAELLGRPER